MTMAISKNGFRKFRKLEVSVIEFPEDGDQSQKDPGITTVKDVRSGRIFNVYDKQVVYDVASNGEFLTYIKPFALCL